MKHSIFHTRSLITSKKYFLLLKTLVLIIGIPQLLIANSGTILNKLPIPVHGHIWTGSKYGQRCQDWDFYLEPNAQATYSGHDRCYWTAISFAAETAGDVYHWSDQPWRQMPGALAHIAVGNATTMWGINKAGVIYQLIGTDWQPRPGNLTTISVAADNSVWGVNESHQVFQWDYKLQNWKDVPNASLVTLSAISAGNVWGVNAQGKVYQKIGGDWFERPGPVMKKVAASADGIVVGINAQGDVFEWAKNAWTKMTGSLTDISVGNRNALYGLDATGQVLRWFNGSWQIIDGNLRQISVGSDGTLAGVIDNGRIFTKPSPEWIKVTGKLKQIAIGNVATTGVWGINIQQQVFQWINNTWQLRPGKLTSIAAAPDGTVVGTSADEKVWQWDYAKNDWQQMPNAYLVTIATGGAGFIWGINGAGKIYQKIGGDWFERPGSLQQISVGSDGTVWGVNSIGEVYQWVGSKETNWIKMPGTMLSVTVVNATTIWATDASGHLFTWTGTDWKPQLGTLTHIAVGSDGSRWGINAIEGGYSGFNEYGSEYKNSNVDFVIQPHGSTQSGGKGSLQEINRGIAGNVATRALSTTADVATAAGEAVTSTATTAAHTITNTALQAYEGAKKIANTVAGGVDTGIELVKGVIATATDIKPVIESLLTTVNDLSTIVNNVTTNIRSISTEPEPWSIADKSLSTTQEFLTIPGALYPSLDALATMLHTMGERIVKIFKPDVGTTMMSVADGIHTIGAKVTDVTKNINTALPPLRQSTHNIHQYVNTIVNDIQATKF
jgi:virginiamycin B lyase